MFEKAVFFSLSELVFLFFFFKCEMKNFVLVQIVTSFFIFFF